MADKTRETGFKARPAAGRAAELAKKVERARGMVLVAVVALLLLSAMGYLAVCVVKPALAPSAKLLLDNRNITRFPECSFQTLASGTFQSDFEKAASDHIPCRDELLKTNAAAQRLGIRTANLLFGYEAIPTYYGSDYAEVPEAQFVQALPAAQSEEMETTLGANADALNSLSEKIDGKLVYYRPARLDCSSFSPAAKLMKNVETEGYVQEKLFDKLDEKWQIIANTYTSLEEYGEDYFRTDHHWKISGAVKGYKSIMDALDRDPLNLSEPKSVGWSAWYGSTARVGIDCTVEGDEVQDVDYERSALKVTIDGKKKNEEALDKIYSAKGAKSYTPKKNYENYYRAWFHGDYGIITIENPSCSNDDTLLIIGDSYSNCIERFFAESYSRVVVVDPRHFKGSLSALIDEEKPRDLVCIFCDFLVRGDWGKATKMLAS